MIKDKVMDGPETSFDTFKKNYEFNLARKYWGRLILVWIIKDNVIVKLATV